MKVRLIVQLWVLLMLIFWQINLFAQNGNNYKYLEFKEFLSEKVEHDTSFVIQLYTQINYPLDARQNRMEGIVAFLIINHDEKNVEIKKIGIDWPFDNAIDELETAFNNTKIKRNDPFITKLYINYDLDCNKFSKKLIKTFHLGLFNNNTISACEYYVPEFRNHYHSYQYNYIGQYKKILPSEENSIRKSILELKKDKTYTVTTTNISIDKSIPNGTKEVIHGFYKVEYHSIKFLPAQKFISILIYQHNLKRISSFEKRKEWAVILKDEILETSQYMVNPEVVELRYTSGHQSLILKNEAETFVKKLY